MLTLPTRGSKAFTLLELIVVIVILGILAAIAIPTFQKAIVKSKKASLDRTLEAVDRDARAIAAFEEEAVGEAHLITAADEVNGDPGSFVVAPDGTTVTLTKDSLCRQLTVVQGASGTLSDCAAAPATVDLTNATWSASTSMQSHRYALTAGVSTDGTMYALGGANNTTAEKYDAATSTWISVADMPTNRVWMASATDSSGRMYAIGGESNGQSGTELSSVDQYDPVTNTWKAIAPMGTRRAGAMAAGTPDGYVYVMGGHYVASDGKVTRLTSVERYDPATNTWNWMAAMPSHRDHAGIAVAADGTIYVMGGETWSGAHTFLYSMDRYDPATNTWSASTSMPVNRSRLASAVDSMGNIYAIGGTRGLDGVPIKTVTRYDPGTDTWTYAADLVTARRDASAVLGADRSIYTLGGYGSAPLQTVERLG